MSQTAAGIRFLSWLRSGMARDAHSSFVTLRAPTLVTPELAPTTPRYKPADEGEQLRWLEAETHARLLCHVVYLGRQPVAPGGILSRDLKQIYSVLCGELNFAEHSWQAVSNLTRRQLGPTKTYCWHVAEDGKRSRLRVFKFMRIRPCVLTDEEQMLIAPLCR
jgi:hypothetical protein